jgi:hypothetical protein
MAAAALLLSYAAHLGGGAPHPVSMVLLAVAILAAGAAAAGLGPPHAATTLDRLLLFGLAAQLALMIVMPIGEYLVGVTTLDRVLWISALVAALMASLWLLRSGRVAWPVLGFVIALHFGLGIWTIAHSPEPFIDVWHFQQKATDALVEGTNPYRPIYDDIYDGTSPYYGPGIVEDGGLTVGFPYPPLSLVLAAPGKLLAGDHRFAQLVALELAAVLIFLTGPSRTTLAAALCILFMPRTLLVVERGFTEPFGVLMLALVGFTSVRAPWLLSVAVGLLIAIKQYLLLGLPLAVLLLRRSASGRLRLALGAVVIAGIVTLPLALLDSAAFVNSTVRFLASQPFRPDSMTFLTLAPKQLASNATIIGFALLALGLVLVVVRTPRSMAGFMAALAFLLLLFFAFGKQGAINYYFLIGAALFIGVAVAEASEHCREARIGTLTSGAEPRWPSPSVP